MKGAVSFLVAAVVSFPAVAVGQAFPVPLLGGPGLLSPAASSDGQTVVFGSAVAPSGVATNTTNLYVDLAASSGDVLRQLTDFSGNPIPLGATAVSLSPDGTTVLGVASLSGTCGTCHDSPNVGNHSFPAPLNIGVGDLTSPLDVSYLPVITLQNNATGRRVQTTHVLHECFV